MRRLVLLSPLLFVVSCQAAQKAAEGVGSTIAATGDLFTSADPEIQAAVAAVESGVLDFGTTGNGAALAGAGAAVLLLAQKLMGGKKKA